MSGISLSEKTATAIGLLRKGAALALAMSPEHGYWAAFSGGKDSQVALDLLRKAGVKYTAIYNVTGNDAPENVYFIRKHYPDVRFYHPKEKFIRLVEKKGLPLVGMRFCCERLKERVAGGHVVVTGVRAEESRKRAQYGMIDIYSRRKEHEGKDRKRDVEWLQQVEHQCLSGQDRVMVRPVFEFTESEIWQYVHENGLPVNPLYSTVGRVGCMFCPFAPTAQIEYYEQAHPGFKNALLKAVWRHQQSSGKHLFDTPEEEYAWWKSHQTISQFKSRNL